MTSPPLLLASSSPYRASLLKRLGLSFRTAPHRVDEDAYKGRGLEPAALAQVLAEAKARSLAEDATGEFVLGGDQVATIDGEILGKPGRNEAAEQQLRRLAGRTHQLLTATALLTPTGAIRQDLHVHHMTMRPLTDVEISRYVAHDAPLDCCGAYRIEALGISLFERIDGDDHTAIEGVPLMRLSRMLRAEGWALP